VVYDPATVQPFPDVNGAELGALTTFEVLDGPEAHNQDRQ
jgi:hypothetical protein